MAVASVLFWACLVVCLYVYFGYPLLLAALGRVRRREVRKQPITPAASVLIAAHNEAARIAEKLENSLALDYPREQLEVIVASDGSTDETEAIVSRYEPRGVPRLRSGRRPERSRMGGVRLLRLPRGGKASALNAAAAAARGELLIFTDANAIFEPGALRKLIANVADPTVGGVCGNQRYRRQRAGDSAGSGEELYWTYDKWIKRLETRVGSCVAADGSIYAIRRALFVPIADPAQADDFAISARVILQGFRLVFEPGAVSYEAAPASSEGEFRRKARVTNRSLRGIWNARGALNPVRTGFYAIELWSHKLLRHLVPCFLLIALVTNAALAQGSAVYRLLFIGQLLFYAAAALGYGLRRTRWGRLTLLYGPLYFCLANLAALGGILSLLRGRRIALWQPAREAA